MSATEAVLHEVAQLQGHTDRVWCVAWSPNGQALASASGECELLV